MVMYVMVDVVKYVMVNDCWMVIGDGVYDLMKFVVFYLGGVLFIVVVVG